MVSDEGIEIINKIIKFFDKRLLVL
jgi:hypothetical protein